MVLIWYNLEFGNNQAIIEPLQIFKSMDGLLGNLKLGNKDTRDDFQPSWSM